MQRHSTQIAESPEHVLIANRLRISRKTFRQLPREILARAVYEKKCFVLVIEGDEEFPSIDDYVTGVRPVNLVFLIDNEDQHLVLRTEDRLMNDLARPKSICIASVVEVRHVKHFRAQLRVQRERRYLQFRRNLLQWLKVFHKLRQPCLRVDCVITQVRQQVVPISIFLIEAFKGFRYTVFSSICNETCVPDIVGSTSEATNKLQRDAQALVDRVQRCHFELRQIKPFTEHIHADHDPVLTASDIPKNLFATFRVAVDEYRV